MLKFNCRTVIWTGLATMAIVGYCIYFDQKRRKDPHYKRRIYERREFDRRLKLPQIDESMSPVNVEVVEYFLQRVYLGETYFRRNDWNRAVHNFANAIMICANPSIFLYKLHKVMPKEFYDLIMARVQLLINTSDAWSGSSSTMSDVYENYTESSTEGTDSQLLDNDS
ncbi:mitochondrial import receptor subunit TOM20 homolog B-like [Drosophila innubila]|uniref:mitochondrial import receptor subunit TOM20 homolog B-like n=1 Tax=Drosophila innubila TaxID=198719 RepID=UPI00148B3EF5|nr:mitochondrial import receptor subunit TOM20 homolog B-like [Drosophila innubila]